MIVGADNANGGVPFPGASAADNVPGTNLHAASGANPIWNIEGDMENPVSAPGQQVNPLFNKINDGDTTSNGSGDSVLIGVEDQAEFNQYRGHKDVRNCEISFTKKPTHSIAYLLLSKLTSPKTRSPWIQTRMTPVGNQEAWKSAHT